MMLIWYGNPRALFNFTGPTIFEMVIPVRDLINPNFGHGHLPDRLSLGKPRFSVCAPNDKSCSSTPSHLHRNGRQFTHDHGLPHCFRLTAAQLPNHAWAEQILVMNSGPIFLVNASCQILNQIFQGGQTPKKITLFVRKRN